MPTPKKPPVSPKTPLKLSRSHHSGLIDPRITRDRSGRLLKIGLAVAILTFLAVAGFTYYALFNKNPLKQDFTPEIIVPEQSDQSVAPTTPTTTPTTTAEVNVVVQQVEILATPTGYLNVRQGPSTASAKVGQVTPGETYMLLAEDAAAGWYQIKLSETKSGWITKQYAKIK